MLEKPGKNNRQIFNARLRHTPLSQSVTMMTSTHKGIELACEFGDSFATILHQIWNLRITYPDPDSDIVCQANDVKSCSRQIKHHLDVAGAFSYVIARYSTCNVASPLAVISQHKCGRSAGERLFTDESLLETHRQYLDQLC
jgi:hypothetical protein